MQILYMDPEIQQIEDILHEARIQELELMQTIDVDGRPARAC